MSNKFFITTAIDYPNGPPHIGHAYEKVLADVIARYRRLRGDQVYYLTGVDQHGQKMQQTADQEGVNVATLAKRNTKKFIALWEKLGLRYDGWAETTDERHKQCVQRILSTLHDEGQLYKKAYRGFYSIRQEQYLTQKDRTGAGHVGSAVAAGGACGGGERAREAADHAAGVRAFCPSGLPIPANRRYQSAVANMNRPDRMVLRSVTQATDSTLTGCTANNAAANNAPGTLSRNSTRQNRSTVPAISKTLVT